MFPIHHHITIHFRMLVKSENVIIYALWKEFSFHISTIPIVLIRSLSEHPLPPAVEYFYSIERMIYTIYDFITD